MMKEQNRLGPCVLWSSSNGTRCSSTKHKNRYNHSQISAVKKSALMAPGQGDQGRLLGGGEI